MAGSPILRTGSSPRLQRKFFTETWYSSSVFNVAKSILYFSNFMLSQWSSVSNILCLNKKNHQQPPFFSLNKLSIYRYICFFKSWSHTYKNPNPRDLPFKINLKFIFVEPLFGFIDRLQILLWKRRRMEELFESEVCLKKPTRTTHCWLILHTRGGPADPDPKPGPFLFS